MRCRGRGCGGLDAQFLEAVVGPCGLQCRADGQRLDAPGVVDGVIVGRDAAQVLSRVAGGVVCEGPCCCGALLDVGQAVVGGWIGVGVDRAVGSFAQAVAVGIVGPQAGAIERDGGRRAGQAGLVRISERLIVRRRQPVNDAGEVGQVRTVVEPVDDLGCTLLDDQLVELVVVQSHQGQNFFFGAGISSSAGRFLKGSPPCVTNTKIMMAPAVMEIRPSNFKNDLSSIVIKTVRPLTSKGTTLPTEGTGFRG
jgi:hypothetical protein